MSSPIRNVGNLLSLVLQDLHKAASYCVLTRVNLDDALYDHDLIFHISSVKMARYLEKQDYGMFELVVPQDGKISLWETLMKAKFAATPQQIENFRNRYLPNGQKIYFNERFHETFVTNIFQETNTLQGIDHVTSVTPPTR